jgi:hypothetical protein
MSGKLSLLRIVTLLILISRQIVYGELLSGELPLRRINLRSIVDGEMPVYRFSTL